MDGGGKAADFGLWNSAQTAVDTSLPKQALLLLRLLLFSLSMAWIGQKKSELFETVSGPGTWGASLRQFPMGSRWGNYN